MRAGVKYRQCRPSETAVESSRGVSWSLHTVSWMASSCGISVVNHIVRQYRRPAETGGAMQWLFSAPAVKNTQRPASGSTTSSGSPSLSRNTCVSQDFETHVCTGCVNRARGQQHHKQLEHRTTTAVLRHARWGAGSQNPRR